MFNKFKSILGGTMPAGNIEYIVAGLGNPGREYENTRHNAGFMALDHVSKSLNFDIKKLKYKNLYGECMVKGKRVLFLKPSNYMNNSGLPVREMMNFYKIPITNLIVIADDINLEVGQMRIKRKGSDGGQKGIRDIIYHMGDDNFPRIKIGIGTKPHKDMQLADWVLSKLTPDNLKALAPVLENTLTALELIISGDIDSAMNKFN